MLKINTILLLMGSLFGASLAVNANPHFPDLSNLPDLSHFSGYGAKPDFTGKPTSKGKPDHAKGPKEGKGKPDEIPANSGQRVNVCHNGGSYNVETGQEDPISFVISVPPGAHKKHLYEDLDCLAFSSDDSETVNECELQEDGITIMCQARTPCTCLDDQ